MKTDIFDQVGRRTPYHTPDGYFEASEKALRTKANHQSAIIFRKLSTADRRWYYIIAASIAVFIGIFGILYFVLPTATEADVPVYSEVTDTAADWSDFAEADIFLDNMNW